MIIGVTGGAGCGKSTISNVARRLGWAVWDADHETKILYRDSYELKVWLYHHIPSAVDRHGVIDKGEIVHQVSHDRALFDALADTIRILLEERLEPFLNSLEGNCVLDVPLLLEAGWQRYCDEVVVVHCSKEIQMERLVRRGWPRYWITAVLDAQWDDERRFPHAHHLIDSSQPFDSNTVEEYFTST